MEPKASPARLRPDEIYVLKKGEILGPFSEADLREAMKRGEFLPNDFVQQGGIAIWQPLRLFLGTAVEPTHGPLAPDWKSIFVWAAIRLRHDVTAGSFALGLVCLMVGTILVALQHWPVAHLAPWFLVPALVGVFAMKGGRPLLGFGLLLLVAAVPVVRSLILTATAPRPETELAQDAPTAIPGPALPESSPQPLELALQPTPPAPLEANKASNFPASALLDIPLELPASPPPLSSPPILLENPAAAK